MKTQLTFGLDAARLLVTRALSGDWWGSRESGREGWCPQEEKTLLERFGLKVTEKWRQGWGGGGREGRKEGLVLCFVLKMGEIGACLR